MKGGEGFLQLSTRGGYRESYRNPSLPFTRAREMAELQRKPPVAQLSNMWDSSRFEAAMSANRDRYPKNERDDRTMTDCQTAHVTDTIRPTVGTTLTMIPGTGEVEFTTRDTGESWRCPIVGYAVVVTYIEPTSRYDDYGSVPNGYEYEASLSPVVIALGDVETVRELTCDGGEWDGVKWEVITP